MALTRVSRATGNAASLDELLHIASEQAALLADTDRSLVLLVDSAGTLRIHACHGVDAAAADSFAERLAATDDQGLLAKLASVFGCEADAGVQVVPLLVLGRVTGFLAVGPAEGGMESTAREEILTALASQWAGPLECSGLSATIRESRLLADTAEQATGVGVMTWNVISGVRTWSPEIYRLHGIDPSLPPSHEAWQATVHPDDFRRIMADEPGAWTRPRDSARPGFREEEYRAVLPDGTVRWLVARTRIERDEAGGAVQLLGVCFDITERKRVEEAIRGSERRLRLATEALAGFVYDADLSTNRVTFYGDLEGVLGFDPSDAPPDLAWWAAQVHPDDESIGSQAWRRAVDGGDLDYHLEYRVRHRDGHYLDVLDRGRIVRDTTGRAVRVVGGTTNISERRQLERERETLLLEERMARAAAERAARARDEVLGIVTHDLRAPLSVIDIAARALSSDTAPSVESVGEVARLLGRSIEWMGRMIDDLLDVANIETGRLGLVLRDETPHVILFQAALMFTPAARDGGVDLSVQAPHDLPLIHADAQRILQALGNLVTNAIKASEPGDRITLRAEGGRSGVRFTVDDTGKGIAPDTLAQLFDHVSRQHRRATAGGVGLGLAIVRGIVSAHGGKFSAQSTPGVGSRFSFTIPVVGG
jgi:PAS domain S-box-containing protein